ncbi:hypothetical protein Bhyg_13452 [Pseudolycoriella hygida]|uniref:Uncharacterized protein n=1 Tax=Pseudolycoriella hygida TaxID=35572 RepID=A0A9Q0RWC5_9DIPT|nr:hypothetical protein Bhyg_13452 [Pseudolycoriella hygida]
MNLKLFFVGCIVATLAVQIAAQCLCGAEGEDVCSCGLTRIPRPQQLRLQPTAFQRQKTCSCTTTQNRQQFSPVGDRCSCGNSAVLPALRPRCTCQVGQRDSSAIRPPTLSLYSIPNRNVGLLTTNNNGRTGGLPDLRSQPFTGGISLNRRVFAPQPNLNLNSWRISDEHDTVTNSALSSIPIDKPSDCGRTIHAPFETNVFSSNLIKKEDYSSAIPVDPVSMSLAYKSAQQASIQVPEEKLAFGFKKLPANAENVKHVPNIPEERLTTFNRKVVDLGYLNYNQMGYYPQKHVDAEFAVAQYGTEIEEPKVSLGQEPIQELGSCGYRPGKIVNNANNDEIRAFIVRDDAM